METFDQWYDRQPMVFFDRKTEHWLTWEGNELVYRICEEGLAAARRIEQ